MKNFNAGNLKVVGIKRKSYRHLDTVDVGQILEAKLL